MFLLLILCTGSLRAQTKLMAIGDSITFGWDSLGQPSTGGYRWLLTQLLDEASISYEMVGSQSDGPGSGWDKDHEGYSGIRIEELENGGFDKDPSYPGILARLTTHQPDALLLMIGTNNKRDGAATAFPRLESLIASIYAQDPDVEVFLGNLPPRTDDAEGRTFISEFNARIPALVAAQVDLGRKIHLVDLHGAMIDRHIDDGVHQTEAGYDAMAKTWFASLQPFLGNPTGNKAPSVAISSPAENASINGPLTIEATASDQDGSVQRVDFLVNQAYVGSATEEVNGLWSFTLDTPPNGSFDLRARAVDNRGASYAVQDAVRVNIQAPAPRIAGLVGHWPLDANQDAAAYDASGFGNHLILGNNTRWTDATPVAPHGLRIDDSMNRSPTSVRSAAQLNHATDFSFSGWVRWENSKTPYPRFFGQKGRFSIGLYKMEDGDTVGELYLNVRSPDGDSTRSQNIRPGLNLNADTWYFVAVTKQGGSYRFRLDDTEVTRSGPSTLAASSEDYTIMSGGTVKGVGVGITASITDYRFYSRALSSSELTTVKESLQQNPPPEAPSGLGARTRSATRIDLSWTDNSDTESTFLIQRSLSSASNFSTIHTTAANVQSYTDTVPADTVFFYQVLASDGDQLSSPSNEVTASTKDRDLDGMLDDHEVLAGTDPDLAADVFQASVSPSAASSISFEFEGKSGKFYRVFFSDALNPADWQILSNGVDYGNLVGEDAVLKVEDDASASRFYKIEVKGSPWN